jgi:hypothetical protein
MSNASTRNVSPFDPNNTWDNDESVNNFSQFTFSSNQNFYDDKKSASMDSIVQAFSNSNAMQILREDSRQTNSN